MKLNTKITTFLSTLLVTGTVFAQPICPELSELQAVGFSGTFGSPGYYFAYQTHPYNTDSNWGFIMGPFKVDLQADAVESANKILTAMIASPIYHDECVYETGIPELHAIAIKDPVVISARMKQYINKF